MTRSFRCSGCRFGRVCSEGGGGTDLTPRPPSLRGKGGRRRGAGCLLRRDLTRRPPSLQGKGELEERGQVRSRPPLPLQGRGRGRGSFSEGPGGGSKRT